MSKETRLLSTQYEKVRLLAAQIEYLSSKRRGYVFEELMSLPQPVAMAITAAMTAKDSGLRLDFYLGNRA